jgi:hypothetical protein
LLLRPGRFYLYSILEISLKLEKMIMIDKSFLEHVLIDLNLYRDIIIGHDIHEAIKSKSNYLAALGLSVNTEVFGGFYNGLE